MRGVDKIISNLWKEEEKMKRNFFILAVVVLMAYFVGSVAIAGEKDQHDGKDNGNDEHSNVGELNLYQKCTGNDTAEFCASTFDLFSACPLTDDVTPHEARVGSGRGKLKYNKRGPTFDFEFEGHGLTPEKSYTLIYLPNVNFMGNCPGYYFVYFGSDVAKRGNVHIEGSLDTGDLPATIDFSPGGAKIWLVLSEDLYLPWAQFMGWHPSMYLFEEELITYTYTSH